MGLLFIGLLLAIAATCGALMVFTRMRTLDSAAQQHSHLPDINRYQPMLRLLSDADFNLPAITPAMRRKLQTRRRELFRGYLRCLAKDYGRLLAGLRRVMTESGTDRPDLAKALAKNRLMFAMALCRIEVSLQLQSAGIGTVDVSGLVRALDSLRTATSALTPAAHGAY